VATTTRGARRPTKNSRRQDTRSPPQPQPCVTKRRVAMLVLPWPTLFYGPGVPVHIGRISCSIELLFEVLFSFPLRYLFAIGYRAFIFSLGWPAPPLFSRHYQAGLLAGARLRQASDIRSSKTPCARGVSARVLCRSPSGAESLGPHFPPSREAGGIQSRANPCSLAVTRGISVDFFSSAD